MLAQGRRAAACRRRRVDAASVDSAAVPRALVTGGAGFIGSALIRALAAEGYGVRVVDDLSSGDPANLAGHRRGAAPRATCATSTSSPRRPRGCDVVFHLAAGAGVVESINDPLRTSTRTPAARSTALEAARRAERAPARLLVVERAAGRERLPRRARTSPSAPLSPYGASKAAGEAYCSAFHGAYGMEAVVVRFSNAYGPRSAHKGNVIPLFIRRLRAGEELVVYGDGSQTRDFVFCEDLAAGPDRRRARRPVSAARSSSSQAASRRASPRLLELLGRGLGDHAAGAPRAAPPGRDPAQLLADRQGPRRFSGYSPRSSWRGPAAHVGLVRRG